MIPKMTHTFGFKLPKMVTEAVAIDKKNWNTLWQGAMQNEMELVKVTSKPNPGVRCFKAF